MKRRSFISGSIVATIGGLLASVFPFSAKAKASPVVLEVPTKVPPLPDFVKGFAYHRATVTETAMLGEDFQTRLSLVGQFIGCIPGDYPMPLVDPSPPFASDFYDKHLKLEPGFKRISIDWNLDWFRQTLDFKIIDEKIDRGNS